MSPALAGGFFTTSAIWEAQYLGWQVHISNYWFTERSTPSSKLRGDLSKASHEQRGKLNQQRWRWVMTGNRPPSGHADTFPGEAEMPAALLPLCTWDTLWPSRTLPWPDLVVLWPDSVSPPGKLRVLTVTSSGESQDFLLQVRTQQLRAASSTASSALPKATLLGLHAIPPYLLSQWNPVTFSQMMNWKLDISVTNFSFYIMKPAFYPLKRRPALWGWRLTHCANGADLSLRLRGAQKRSNYSCMCSCRCAQLTDFKE